MRKILALGGNAPVSNRLGLTGMCWYLGTDMARLKIDRIEPGTDAEVDALAAEMDAMRPVIAVVTSLEDDVNGRRLGDLFKARARYYRNLDDLRKYGNERILLSFSTSLIIPEEILQRFPGGAYNLHSASPQYPGRDPHHWAIYDGATQYGATLHHMTKRVDDGPIVDVEMFDVPDGATPSSLLAMANEASVRILHRRAPNFIAGIPLVASTDLKWTGKKHSRRDFLAMCTLPADISENEFKRRYHAFDGDTYDNLTTFIHGQKFRISKSQG